MSNFLARAKHPDTGEWHDVLMIDDYYGRHRYGVRFPNGRIFPEDDVTWEHQDNDESDSE